MNRDDLAVLLSRADEAHRACRQAVLAGAQFTLDDEAVGVPADVLSRIYARRESLTARGGRRSLGFAVAVGDLQAAGQQRLRIGAVDTENPWIHFQLFFDEELSTVVACLGVEPSAARVPPTSP